MEETLQQFSLRPAIQAKAQPEALLQVSDVRGGSISNHRPIIPCSREIHAIHTRKTPQQRWGN
jgi:hypothetical protein